MAFPDLGRAGSRGQKRARGNRKRGKRARSGRNTGMWPKLAPRAPRAPFPPAPRWAPGTPGPSRERPDPHRTRISTNSQWHPRSCPSALPRMGAAPPAKSLRVPTWSLLRGARAWGAGRTRTSPSDTTRHERGRPRRPDRGGNRGDGRDHGRRSDPWGQRPGRVGSGVTRVQAGQEPGRDRG